MGTTGTTVSTDELVASALERIAADLAMIVDRQVSIDLVVVERVNERPAGEGRIHISFKLGFRTPSGERQGCLLVPLPDAVSLAAYLMMTPDEAVAAQRETQDLDRVTKDALLEIGNFVGGASDTAVRDHCRDGHAVRSDGCQGVRAGVRPALRYEEGDELVVGRARARIHDFPEFELILVLPSLG